MPRLLRIRQGHDRKISRQRFRSGPRTALQVTTNIHTDYGNSALRGALSAPFARHPNLARKEAGELRALYFARHIFKRKIIDAGWGVILGG
jgi:hypothetical protein